MLRVTDELPDRLHLLPLFLLTLLLLLVFSLSGVALTGLLTTERILRNTAWTPQVQTIGGVAMVLVPAGCFWMGARDTSADERPVHGQCFDKAFWIDRYEVTNAQYGSSGYFTGANQPRDSVSWFEANDHCAARGARLPTEAEWEYAARGPDGLTFPWGDEFDAARLLSGESGQMSSIPVGRFPAGASWVGAHDMSGNVAEWVSSHYIPYPYRPDDGREDGEDETRMRAWRGGSWDSIMFYTRASNRYRREPSRGFYDTGFRCAMDAAAVGNT
jgi:formylglycine-generating enzyme required for sulfatase activity